jgi:hypothetical protein
MALWGAIFILKPNFTDSLLMHKFPLIGFPGEMKHWRSQKKRTNRSLSALVIPLVIGAM